ncbi:unnamed protein product [Rotaria socialis]|uniref:Macro domain-containing protein n=3 Tax=Rotaria socialis TaxID=392032 RepID=A0A817WEX8_9BILA|nr:unnamed protein product [Rotaria socialis]
MASKYASLNDEDIRLPSNDLPLCSKYQQNPMSCHTNECKNLHLCHDYVLNSKCSKFDFNGKCSHSHSLFTMHNQFVLKKRRSVLINDEEAFDKIAQLLRSSKFKSSETVPYRVRQISIPDDNQQAGLTIAEMHKVPLESVKNTISGGDHSNLFAYNRMLLPSFLKDSSSVLCKSGSSQSTCSSLPQQRTFTDQSSLAKEKSMSLSPRISLSGDSSFSTVIMPIPTNFSTHRKVEMTSHSVDLLDERFEQPRKTTPNRFSKGIASTFLGTDEVNEKVNNSQLTVPLATRNEKTGFKYFHLHVKHNDKVPTASNPIDSTKRLTQTKYVFDKYAKEHEILSSRTQIERDKLYSRTAERKPLYIQSTNSTIDVISGDITQIETDMIVCVTTSATLLRHVLTQAGSSIESQFLKVGNSTNDIILNGGSTKARHILFLPWYQEVQAWQISKAHESLSKLVIRCLQYAHEQKLKSIAFPPIGTGKIGLDPNKVCEFMIMAANKYLQQHKLDVMFVIYSSQELKHHQQTYQIFRDYLDTLCLEVQQQKVKIPLSNDVLQPTSIGNPRSQSIQRTVKYKQIRMVSELSNIDDQRRRLEKALRELICEKTYDLCLVRRHFIDQVEILIDICLAYHVLPHVDFSKNELRLFGDHDSCTQCYANLRPESSIFKYYIYRNGKTSDEIKMNMYQSLKIDEAILVNESKILIEGENDIVFDIDLKNFQVNIKGDRRPAQLCRKELNEDSKIIRPSIWISPSLRIQTFQVTNHVINSTECVRAFQQSMPISEWFIEQVDAIQNWPLYVHVATKKCQHDAFVFYGCSFSSVQSTIHYGLYSNRGEQQGTIQLTRAALDSHICNTRRSTDGKYYIFAVQVSTKTKLDQNFINISNNDANLALPTHLIIYRRQKIIQ